MVIHGRVELLAHPLSQKYLQMKWNSYGKYFHIANLLFYSIFLGFVTCFSSQLALTQNTVFEYRHSGFAYGTHSLQAALHSSHKSSEENQVIRYNGPFHRFSTDFYYILHF